MKIEFSRKIFENSDIKFYQNPSSGSPVVPCGPTDGQTVVAKRIVAFRNFANAPKSYMTVLRNTAVSFRPVFILALIP
jgi:hypothetical protein